MNKPVDETFDTLAKAWIGAKDEELKAASRRRSYEAQLLEYTGRNVGTIHTRSKAYDVQTEVKTEVKPNGEDWSVFVAAVGSEIANMVLIPTYTFSKTGLSSAIKHLSFRATFDRKAQEGKEKLATAVKDLTVFEESKSPTFSVIERQ